MSGKGFYAVRIGRIPGIYTTWAEAEAQVNGYPGAKHKKFATKEEAQAFIDAPEKKEKIELVQDGTHIDIYTDGSFRDGFSGWGYVLIKDGVPFFEAYGPTQKYIEMRNISSELEAAEQALMKAIQLGAKSITIYHDYEGIGSWADEEWKTKKVGTTNYVALVKMARANAVVNFVKVKGHSSNRYNDRADQLAQMGTMANKKVEEYLL